jgi:hypothetical protein
MAEYMREAEVKSGQVFVCRVVYSFTQALNAIDVMLFVRQQERSAISTLYVFLESARNREAGLQESSKWESLNELRDWDTTASSQKNAEFKKKDLMHHCQPRAICALFAYTYPWSRTYLRLCFIRVQMNNADRGSDKSRCGKC